MKVWCLTRFANQSFRMLGVYTTRRKAENAVEKHALKEWRALIKTRDATSQQKSMNKKMVVDRFWRVLEIDLEEMEVDAPIA